MQKTDKQSVAVISCINFNVKECYKLYYVSNQRAWDS